VEWVKNEMHDQLETHHILGNDSQSKSNRFYLVAGAFTLAYIYLLYKASQSKSEIIRMGAAGSLTVLIGEGSFYFIDAVNTRSKVLVTNTHVTFRQMFKDVV